MPIPVSFYESDEVSCRIIFSDRSSATFPIDADEFIQETVTRTSKALNAGDRPVGSVRRHPPHPREPIMNISNAVRETLAKLIESDGAALLNDRDRCKG